MPQSPRNKSLASESAEATGDENIQTKVETMKEGIVQEAIEINHNDQRQWWADQDERDAVMAKRRRSEDERILTDLSEPFPPEMERELRKGGTTLIYIPVSEVIARLNRIFGVRGWSTEIIKCERDALDPDFIVAHVRLSVTMDGGWGAVVTKDGFGGQKIKRTKQGEIVDLGDEFKGAVSDALKKAAQQFGVGLYLSRSDEALNLEIERDHATNAPQIDPNISALWSKFRELSKDFDATQKSKLNEFWTTHSGGRPKPSPETATMHDVMALIEESVRIALPGSEFSE
jgi:recombination DNA repair RAD52 pathway protein